MPSSVNFCWFAVACCLTYRSFAQIRCHLSSRCSCSSVVLWVLLTWRTRKPSNLSFRAFRRSLMGAFVTWWCSFFISRKWISYGSQWREWHGVHHSFIFRDWGILRQYRHRSRSSYRRFCLSINLGRGDSTLSSLDAHHSYLHLFVSNVLMPSVALSGSTFVSLLVTATFQT